MFFPQEKLSIKDGRRCHDDLVAAIGRHKDVITALEAAKSLEIEDTYILGPLLILQHIFTRFGIKTLLAKIAVRHPQLQLDFERIVFTMIVCRFGYSKEMRSDCTQVVLGLLKVVQYI